MKCTHNSSGVIVCTDKKSFDVEAARKKLVPFMTQNYYWLRREWPYKNVKPRIIAEKYIDSLGKPESIEYKVTCADGKVNFVTICTGIAHDAFELRTNDHYDVNFNHMPWYAIYKNAKTQPHKPEQWEELISFCEKLSEGIPSVRVDTYIVDGQILFGEMTFYTWGGNIIFTPPEWDEKLGSLITLPDHKLL